MKFDGFYGNDSTKEYLSSAFARSAFPHALLIAGERGIGKKTLADIVARALVCESGNPPCDNCPSCKKALNGFHPDIIKLGFDDSSIKVDVVRELKRDALIRPNDAERKVYIFNNAGTMTHEAQDALLKILEEPPAFTFFILLCSSYSDLLSTIVSRTAHITLSPLCDSDMARIISEKLPSISREEADELIRTAGGICDFLTSDTNSEFMERAVPIAEALIVRDEFKIFCALNALDRSDRTTLSKVLDELTIILRDAMIIASGAQSRLLSSANANVAKKLAETFPKTKFIAFSDEIADAKNCCVRNVGVSHITGKLVSKFTDIATK